MRISDWSSDVCSSDLIKKVAHNVPPIIIAAGDERSNAQRPIFTGKQFWWRTIKPICEPGDLTSGKASGLDQRFHAGRTISGKPLARGFDKGTVSAVHSPEMTAQEIPQPIDTYLRNVDETQRILQLGKFRMKIRSEEHTSELQSLMRISYAV